MPDREGMHVNHGQTPGSASRPPGLRLKAEHGLAANPEPWFTFGKVELTPETTAVRPASVAVA